MKLQQLRYIVEVARHDLNVSATAEGLYTSQPGISKQIRLLEEELGVSVFVRNGKHLTDITPAGKVILGMAEEILTQATAIKQVAKEFSNEKVGRLSIGTTHGQARYALPKVIKAFMGLYPDVSLHMHQGTPTQMAQAAAEHQVDFVIATEGLDDFNTLVTLPCYQWHHGVVVHKDHPLAKREKMTLRDIATYPLVTYVYGFTGRSLLDRTFAAEHLKPKVIFTAVDADVIKTYVRLGLGVGIIAEMAYDQAQDQDLVLLDASHLFPASVTKIGFRRGAFLRKYMHDFMCLFAPHLTHERVREALKKEEAGEMTSFLDVALPRI